ncbi:unnamed protein product [Arabis nemorensis]|uniref:Uncharacterized protein n=1 Tax=Arabis nemorensis TaxID=586526 RepID=A0A565CUH9_9BRAS|nr:unnamed protein product [Arabis nemorensis]
MRIGSSSPNAASSSWIQVTQTFEREEIQRSTSFEREEIVRLTPFEREEIVRSTPSEREEIVRSTPFERMTLIPQSKMASNTNQSVAIFTYLKESVDRYREQRVEVDERLKSLEAEQAQAEQELSTLQECLSTKEAMMKLIEEKRLFCCLYRKAPPPQSLFLSKKGVFGIVALLGSVSSTSLSRVLSEYLGEDKMLALVCKSPQFGPNSVQYRRLQSEAAKLGRSITTNRLHVRCLESDDATSTWMGGLVENDPQRKLSMDDPKSPDGDPLPGFKGYAVNMIHLGSEELTIQTYSGHGLRETLFYDLFRNLQVYETQKHVEAARPFIDGCKAVSLDGFIVKKNRYIYIGCRYSTFFLDPYLHFISYI